MALQSSGAISLNDIQTEFGGTNPIGINEYYGVAAGVPASGTISFDDFYGTSALAIGDSYQGGYFAGYISTSQNGVATHALVVGPKSIESSLQAMAYNTYYFGGAGPTSTIDGPGNTTTLTNDSNNEAAIYCANLTSGGYSDWYLPAYYELEIAYYNLKPTTGSNNTSENTGGNPYSVPTRTSGYTTSSPGQTSVTVFRSGGSQAFESNPGSQGFGDKYWSSTQETDTRAYVIEFGDGRLDSEPKTRDLTVRPFRRVAL